MTDYKNQVRVGSAWQIKDGSYSLRINAELSGSVRVVMLRNRYVKGSQPTHRLMADPVQEGCTIKPDMSWKKEETEEKPTQKEYAKTWPQRCYDMRRQGRNI